MARRTKYVNIDEEDVRDTEGARIDDAYIERAVERARAFVGVGRPALGTPGTRSPQIAFRVPEVLKAAIEARAKREGKRPSDIAREALEQYLELAH